MSPKAPGRRPYLEIPVDPQKPLMDCEGHGSIEEIGARTIGDLTAALETALLDAAGVSGKSPEILLGVQQAMNRLVERLLADPETRTLGEDLQRLGLRMHAGLGKPPSTRTDRSERIVSAIDEELLFHVNCSLRTANLIKKFLATHFKVEEANLTVRHFIDGFTANGHFDANAFAAAPGVGPATHQELLDALKQDNYITDNSDWSPSFLEKHS